MDCPNISELRYRNFSEHLQSKKESERLPLVGTIEVTNHCNLNCAHCYIKDNSKKGELSFGKCCKIIDEITDAGCLWLTFTGGEPFVRKDFLDIYTHAKKRGLIVMVFTNGTLITPDIANYLKEFKPFCIEISLYGMSRETYKNITGSPDNYDKCMEAISLFRDRKIPFELKSMLIKENKHEIFKMKSFAKTLGVDFRFDFFINPRVDGGKSPCDTRIVPEEGVSMEMTDEDIRKEWISSLKEMSKERDPELLFPCGAGKNLFNIDSSGNLQVCSMIRYINYDLEQVPFREGWEQFPKIISRKIKTKNKCVSCNIYYFCNKCPGWSMMEHGDEEAVVEYICEIAHLRAKAILKEIEI